MSAKIVQLDMFMDQLQTQKLAEHEEYKLVMGKSVRRLFAEINDMNDCIVALKKKIDSVCEAGNGH